MTKAPPRISAAGLSAYGGRTPPGQPGRCVTIGVHSRAGEPGRCAPIGIHSRAGQPGRCATIGIHSRAGQPGRCATIGVHSRAGEPGRCAIGGVHSRAPQPGRMNSRLGKRDVRLRGRVYVSRVAQQVKSVQFSRGFTCSFYLPAVIPRERREKPSSPPHPVRDRGIYRRVAGGPGRAPHPRRRSGAMRHRRHPFARRRAAGANEFAAGKTRCPPSRTGVSRAAQQVKSVQFSRGFSTCPVATVGARWPWALSGGSVAAVLVRAAASASEHAEAGFFGPATGGARGRSGVAGPQNDTVGRWSSVVGALIRHPPRRSGRDGHRLCPAEVWPRIWCGLPRLRPSMPRLDSSALQPAVRGAGPEWPGLRMTRLGDGLRLSAPSSVTRRDGPARCAMSFVGRQCGRGFGAGCRVCARACRGWILRPCDRRCEGQVRSGRASE
jgi:hypothetical protein